MKTTFKSKLESGRTLLGTFLHIPAAEMAEIAGYAGLDCGIVDMEHGMLGIDSAIQMVRGCDAADMAAVCRVPRIDFHRIGHALDIGASAVMVPDIRSRQDAEQVMLAAKYHPAGRRGVCVFTRGARYNSLDEGPDYYRRANGETSVILQIEGQEGIAGLDNILTVPDIACIFIGPFDLAQSLGIPGEVTHRRVFDAISDIVQRAGKKGVAVANFAVTLEQARQYARLGVRFVAYGLDTLIAEQAFRKLREQILDGD